MYTDTNGVVLYSRNPFLNQVIFEDQNGQESEGMGWAWSQSLLKSGHFRVGSRSGKKNRKEKKVAIPS